MNITDWSFFWLALAFVLNGLIQLVMHSENLEQRRRETNADRHGIAITEGGDFGAGCIRGRSPKKVRSRKGQNVQDQPTNPAK